MKENLERNGLNIEEAKVSVQYRSEWRSICTGVRRAVGEFPAQHHEAARWLAVEVCCAGDSPMDNSDCMSGAVSVLYLFIFRATPF